MSMTDQKTTDESDTAAKEIASEREPRARQLRRELFSDEMVDRLLDRVDADDLTLTGKGGFVSEMLKSVLERGMQRELTDHLGYEPHDSAGRGSGNSRNGTSPTTVHTEAGPVSLDRPRDRNGTFTSKVVPKGERRMDGLDGMIISLGVPPCT